MMQRKCRGFPVCSVKVTSLLFLLLKFAVVLHGVVNAVNLLRLLFLYCRVGIMNSDVIIFRLIQILPLIENLHSDAHRYITVLQQLHLVLLKFMLHSCWVDIHVVTVGSHVDAGQDA